MKSLSISLLLRVAQIAALYFLLVSEGLAQEVSQEGAVSRFFFGSCIHQDGDQGVWKSILKKKPEVCLLIGDNIYGDTPNPEVLAKKYRQLSAQPDFQSLRRECHLLATWDDHDYGQNDAGAEFPIKEQSKEVFLDFLGTPKGAFRRSHSGVYDSELFGSGDKTIQVLLLDMRTFRGPLISKPNPHLAGGLEYFPNPDPSASLLGEEQWNWLSVELKKPARLRLLISSIQVLPEESPKEKWANFPRERERLLRLIRESKAKGVILMSGDTHNAELSLDSDSIGYPLFELTSSGLNMGESKWRRPVKNSRRLALISPGSNFGMIQVDWKRTDPLISLEIYDALGELLFRQPLNLSLLQ